MKILETYFIHLLVIAIPPFVNGSTLDEWEYGVHHTKVNHWPGICQRGQKQSPVNINTLEVQRKDNVNPIVFQGYDKWILGEMSTIRNNGHTVTFGFSSNDYPSTITPSIYGGDLTARKYVFLQAHFHWGATNDQGSEHTINNQHTPMEMHFVHWNSEKGNRFNEAVEKGGYDALVVLSVQFKIGKRNQKIDYFFNNVDKVAKQGERSLIGRGIKLNDFLPENTDEFYRYNGSLTTPGCEEVTVWTIFKQHVEISQQQIDKIRRVTYQHDGMVFDNDLSNNYRPTQGLNNRVVLDMTTKIFQNKERSVVMAGWGGLYQDVNTATNIKITGWKAAAIGFAIIIYKINHYVLG